MNPFTKNNSKLTILEENNPRMKALNPEIETHLSLETQIANNLVT